MYVILINATKGKGVFMLMKRLVCTLAAAVMACGCAMTAFAGDKKEEKAIKFKYDKSMVVSEKDKVGYTLSFDNKDWKGYVDLTEDAKKAGLSIKVETDRSYQGASLKISADNKADIADKHNVCWQLKGADGSLKYSDVEEGAEGLTTIGVELNADKFGLSTFDGCMMVMTYRFDEKGVDALDCNSAVLFSAKKKGYVWSGGDTVVQKNTTISDNINQYRQALVSVPTKGNATKLIIEVPISKAYSGEVMTIDNIDICLPGDKGYIKNLDGYNENATPKETVEELQIKEEKEQAEDTQIATEKEHSSKTKGVVIVAIVVVVILLLAGGAVLFVKMKAKYY